ncbi:hypothetical protein [Caballeronia ptereochthonis]|uniref:hypothetical protein n=1 Tax=Caballeronia ptereochthonis TaxID=1777144 RepID=UPI00117F419F|nr:hypothetical protein [Caballeronia ptereochthonis]
MTDWTTLLGYVLYLLVRADGRVQFLHVPLDQRLLESIRESYRKGRLTPYRYANGRLTPFGRHLASFFFSCDVPATAIAYELGVSQQALIRLRPEGLH